MILTRLRKNTFGPKASALWLAWGCLLCAPYAHGAPQVDNNAGTWSDRYVDTSGIVPADSTNYDINVFAGVLSLAAGETSGHVLTTEIPPRSFDAWRSVCMQAGYSTTNDILVDVVETDSGSDITGFTNLSLNGEGCIDLSGLSSAYTNIRLRISLNQSGGSPPPSISDVTVRWNPVTQILLDKEASATNTAGDATLVYRLRYSVNFVQANDLVIWDTLPTNSGGVVYADDYGQDDAPLPRDTNILAKASAGARFWAGPGTTNVHGATIPANSIYWVLGDVPEGTTRILQFVMNSPEGTLDGTLYENDFEAVATNGAQVISATATTLIASVATPSIEKDYWTRVSGEGLFDVNATNYALGTTTVRFELRVGNDCPDSGCSRMYNTVVYDDLRGLSNVLDTTWGESGVSNISAGGYYDPAFTGVVNGTTGVFPAVVWNLGTMEPEDMDLFGSGERLRFSARLLGANDVWATNTVWVDSDQTDPASDDLPFIVVYNLPPPGRPGWWKNLTGCPWYVPCSAYWGDILEFRMGGRNDRSATMEDIIIVDQVPSNTTFISATVNGGSDGAVFYSTTTSYPDRLVPPPTTYSNAPADLDMTGNELWTNTPPATLSDVTWVAFYWPHVSSDSDPSPAYIDRVRGYLKVKVDPPPGSDCCATAGVTNRAHFEIHGYTPIGGGTRTNWNGSTRAWSWETNVFINADQGSFLGTYDEIDPDLVQVPSTATYRVIIDNEGNDSFTSVTARLSWGTIEVNGTPAYPSFAGISGGTITSFDPLNGSIDLALGPMLVGAGRTVELTLSFPEGAADRETFTVSAELTGFDNCCPPITRTLSDRVTLSAFPDLRVTKDDVLNVIPSGTELRYELTARNIGTAPSHHTYVIDRVPDQMVFKRARGPRGETVFVSDKQPPDLPGSLSLTHRLDLEDITTHFTQATVDDGGTPGDPSDDVWTSPFGESTTWVAWFMDDPVKQQFDANLEATVTLTVLNDNNTDPAVTNGSDAGTVIYNDSGILSDENLQALGNEVQTLILEAPALDLDKQSPAGDHVTAGETFTWTIDFQNSSGGAANLVTIQDTLPIDVQFVTATLTWNSVATSNGYQPPHPDDIPSSITTNGGRQVLTFDVIGPAGYTQTLYTLEGGQIEITAQAATNLLSGSLIENCVLGFATNDQGAASIEDCHVLGVENCDLMIVKQVDNPTPRIGDTVNYIIEVSNEGEHDAYDVEIVDVLPVGMQYVTNSTAMLVGGYGIGEPTLSGATSTWSMANGATISNITEGLLGYLPGLSGNLFFTYQATVVSGVQGAAKTNRIRITTSTAEDRNYPNEDEEEVTPPVPDPAVTKQAPEMADPGATVDYAIEYVNNQAEPATNVYLIDTLPDYDLDGTTDVSLIVTSADGPGAVGIWYHTNRVDMRPAFNMDNPTTNGWTNALSGLIVNHIGYSVGTLGPLGGPYRIDTTVRLIHPATGLDLGDGINLTNTIRIFTASNDENLSNNVAHATTSTPGVDMAVDKQGDPQGAFPGAVPGDDITYTLTYQNAGTVDAYGIYLIDTFPGGVTPAGTPDNFAQVFLEDEDGNPVWPLDAIGDDLTDPVMVTRVVGGGGTITWYLGSTNAADSTYYRNVGIPAGAQGQFQVYASVDGSVTDSAVLENEVLLVTTNQAGNDVPEALLYNNEDTAQVVVYRADPVITKTVRDVPDDSESLTDIGHTLRYTIAYDNLGGADAEDTRINDILPAGVRFVPGSFSNLPAGATVAYTPDESTNTTGLEIRLGTLPAPPAYVGESESNDFQGVFSNTEIQDTGDGSITLVGSGGGGGPVEMVFEETFTGTNYTLVADHTNGWTVFFSGGVTNGSNNSGFFINNSTGYLWRGTTAGGGTLSEMHMLYFQDMSDRYTTILENNASPVTWGLTFGDRMYNPSASFNYAHVLCATETNFIDDGKGYVITINNEPADALVFGYYTNGLDEADTANGWDNLILLATNLGEAAGFSGDEQPIGMRVTYEPAGNVWRIYTSTNNPYWHPDDATNLVATVTNSVAVDENMPYHGGLFEASASAATSDRAQEIDNIQIVAAHGAATAGVYTTSIGAGDGFLGWDRLLVSQSLPSETALAYTLFDATGTNVLVPSTNTDAFVDLSGIPVSHTQLVLGVSFSGSTNAAPELYGWTVTYKTDVRPTFSFEVTVDGPLPVTQSVISNDVDIGTTTPEITLTNNQDHAVIQVRRTDLEINKTVDQASALTDDELVYTITYSCLGPQPGAQVIITDAFPTNYVRFDGAGPAPDSTSNTSQALILTWNVGTLADGEGGSLSLTGTVLEAAASNLIVNAVSIANDRQETRYDNNDDTALTFVQTIANLAITKTGPSTVRIGETNQMTLSYVNNGNGPAPDTTITDVLPPDMFFVTSTPETNASPALSWDLGTLAAGASGTITLDVVVTNNAAATRALTNTATIATSTNEVTLSDNADRHPVYVDLALARISGSVWYDANLNLSNEFGEAGIGNVTITLTGTDIFGNPVSQTTATSTDGSYAFPGLNPGVYNLTQTQPAGYESVGASLGIGADSPGYINGSDQFTNIVLGSGNKAGDFDFGEMLLASFGDRIWNDFDFDGVQEDGETGIAGVTVVLYRITGSVTGAVATNVTSAAGFYGFDALTPGTTHTYFVSFERPGTRYEWTFPTNAAVPTDSDAVYAESNTAHEARSGGFLLSPGQNDTSWDAGMIILQGLFGQVRFDADGDGDAGDIDTGLTNILVRLFTDPNGDGDPADGVAIRTNYTDQSGNFAFTNLQPGAYVLVESDRGGFSSTGDNEGTPDDNRIPVTMRSGTDVLNRYFLDTNPTLVVLYGFDLGLHGDTVLVRWETASEMNTVGFYVYRLTAGGWLPIHGSMIPSQGWMEGGIGAQYEIIDPDALPGETYTYKLIEYETDGSQQVYGPFTRSTADLRMKNISLGAGGIVIRWLSRSNDVYALSKAADIHGVFHPLTNSLIATPPVNVYTDRCDEACSMSFYRIEVVAP